MAFHERWFAGPKQRRLAEALLSVPDGEGALVEVGSWEGRSTILIAQAFPDSKVHVIDHWKGDLTDPNSKVAALAEARDVYRDFCENVREAGVMDQLVVHRADWRAVFEHWAEPIRMIFIDGQHTYDEVLDNIHAAQPWMVPGGVICGDDLTVPQVYRAVIRAFGAERVTSYAGPGGSIWWSIV